MGFGMLTEMVRSALAPTWHPARIECFLDMPRGLLPTQSADTCRLAQRMGCDVQFESHAQRVRRLPAEQAFDWSVIGRLPPRLAELPLYHGPLSLRLVIDPSGAAEVRDVMLDRVLHPNPNNDGWEPLREALLDRLEAVRFPARRARRR